MKRNAVLCAVLSACMGFVSTSACQVETDEEAVQFTSVEESNVIEASAQTRNELSIVRWVYEAEEDAVVLSGRSEAGVELASVTFRQSADFKEISTSNGGLIRIDRQGNPTEFVDDPELFTAFSRDTVEWRAQLQDSTFRSCSIWKWIGCSGAVLAAIYACGAFNLPCAAALLKSISCIECFISASGDNGGNCEVTRNSCYPGECGYPDVGCGVSLNCGPCQPCDSGYCADGSCCPNSGVCSNGVPCAL